MLSNLPEECGMKFITFYSFSIHFYTLNIEAMQECDPESTRRKRGIVRQETKLSLDYIPSKSR